ncbi:unnamed protein product, partial [Rotaria sp. Silwood1]
RSHIKDIIPDVQSSNNKKTKIGSLTCVATLECRRNNNCDITLESRRRCSACRLIKCLNNGMKRDRLLTV